LKTKEINLSMYVAWTTGG